MIDDIKNRCLTAWLHLGKECFFIYVARIHRVVLVAILTHAFFSNGRICYGLLASQDNKPGASFSLTLKVLFNPYPCFCHRAAQTLNSEISWGALRAIELCRASLCKMQHSKTDVGPARAQFLVPTASLLPNIQK